MFFLKKVAFLVFAVTGRLIFGRRFGFEMSDNSIDDFEQGRRQIITERLSKITDVWPSNTARNRVAALSAMGDSSNIIANTLSTKSAGAALSVSRQLLPGDITPNKTVIKIVVYDPITGYLNWMQDWFLKAAREDCPTTCIVTDDASQVSYIYTIVRNGSGTLVMKTSFRSHLPTKTNNK
jgi:hypothetical protein